MRKIGQPQGGIVKIDWVTADFARYAQNIARRGLLPCGGQPRAIDVYRILHAQLRRACVHQLHKRLLAARQMLCQSCGAVIAAGYDGRAQQILHAIGCACVQQRGGAGGGRGGLGYGDGIIQRYFAPVQPFQHQQHGHQLGQRGHLARGIRVLFKDDCACFSIRQQIGRRGQLDRRRAFQGLRLRGQAGYAQKNPRQQQGGDGFQTFTHTKSLLAYGK